MKPCFHTRVVLDQMSAHSQIHSWFQFFSSFICVVSTFPKIQHYPLWSYELFNFLLTWLCVFCRLPFSSRLQIDSVESKLWIFTKKPGRYWLVRSSRIMDAGGKTKHASFQSDHWYRSVSHQTHPRVHFINGKETTSTYRTVLVLILIATEIQLRKCIGVSGKINPTEILNQQDLN